MVSERRFASNLSNRINPKNCKKCGGTCCKQFWIWYPANADVIKLSEMYRIRMLSGLQDVIEIIKCGGRGWKLLFKIPCIHLTAEGKCAIYNSPERPMLCRKFPHPGDTPDECPYVGGEEK